VADPLLERCIGLGEDGRGRRRRRGERSAHSDRLGSLARKDERDSGLWHLGRVAAAWARQRGSTCNVARI
jgi:hypothetical protein